MVYETPWNLVYVCEAACTCSLNGESVTVRDNEQAIIENGFAQNLMIPQPPKQRINKKIAVIGSGPSGLAAADCLNHRGYHVTVFERDDRIGGSNDNGLWNSLKSCIRVSGSIIFDSCRSISKNPVGFPIIIPLS